MFRRFGQRSLLPSHVLTGSLVILVSATIVTLVMAWPVMQQPNDLLFGTEIVGRHADAYTVIQGFAERQALGGATQPVVDWVGVWLARWFGAAAAYNILVLISFPLAAVAVFWLARYLRLGFWPATWVSFMFAFSPLHIAHAAYHPHVAQVQWIPLAILIVVAAVDRWSLLRATLIFVIVALTCLANFYSALILTVILPVILWVLRKHPVGSGEGWGRTAWTLAGVAVTAVLYVGFFHTAVFRDPSALAFPTADSQNYSAMAVSYLIPPIDHALLGSIGTRSWLAFDAGSETPLGDALVEQQVYLGWSVLVLAILGALAWRKRPGKATSRPSPLLIVVAGVAFCFSLAPVWDIGLIQIPSPSWLLRSTAPMFRAYARFGFVVQLAVLLLAATTWNAWRENKSSSGRLTEKRWSYWLILALVGVSLIEYLPLPPLRAHSLRPHVGYQLLADEEPGWSVLDCILEPQVRASVAPIADGTVYVADGDVLDCGEPGLARKLASLGVGYVVERPARDLSSRPGFVLQGATGDVAVYSVETESTSVYVRRWNGFSWRDGAGPSSWRWAGKRASWWLSDPQGVPGPFELEVELMAFPEPREVEVRLNGELLDTLTVSARRTWFKLTFTPHSARNQLEFIASGDPTVPDSILGNGDRRQLAFGVGGVRYPSPSAFDSRH